MTIINTVIEALNAAGIPAVEAYSGAHMPQITQATAAVSLEKLEHTARCATVLVTAMAPASGGGAACQQAAVKIGQELEKLGGRCVQEACRFHGYGDAFYVRVLATFYGGAVMEDWNETSEFIVKLNTTLLSNAVSFRADQALDEVTGTPLSTAVWSFRLEEEYGRGEAPPPPPEEPFTVTVMRNGSTEVYEDCTWISMQVENTATGLRQVRSGVATSRGVIMVG